MSLPEIPDEAVAAFEAYLNRQVGHTAPVYIGALERAWPLAYAAALRHAADECWGWSSDGDDVCEALRAAADQATP